MHGYARATLDIDLFIELEQVWQRRVMDRIGATAAAFASLDDLILMKEAAGRPKDLEDLRATRFSRPSDRIPGSRPCCGS